MSAGYIAKNNDCLFQFLFRPEKCPDYLHALMSKCLTHEASERPTFGDILNTLSNEQTQYEVFTTKDQTTYEVPPDAKD